MLNEKDLKKYVWYLPPESANKIWNTPYDNLLDEFKCPICHKIVIEKHRHRVKVDSKAFVGIIGSNG